MRLSILTLLCGIKQNKNKQAIVWLESICDGAEFSVHSILSSAETLARWSRRLLDWEPLGGRRSWGRPLLRWEDALCYFAKTKGDT